MIIASNILTAITIHVDPHSSSFLGQDALESSTLTSLNSILIFPIFSETKQAPPSLILQKLINNLDIHRTCITNFKLKLRVIDTLSIIFVKNIYEKDYLKYYVKRQTS